MSTAITNGIKIEIKTEYNSKYSSPGQNHYVFLYDITIENCGLHSVQLLQRRWVIYQTTGMTREVTGEGVVGQKPILKPQEVFNYTSGTNLKTSIGKIYGYYTMLNITTNKTFKVIIPESILIVPYRLN